MPTRPLRTQGRGLHKFTHLRKAMCLKLSTPGNSATGPKRVRRQFGLNTLGFTPSKPPKSAHLRCSAKGFP